jgi:hypothetical protein
MTEINWAERAARGAALLDEKRPGWVAEVDLPGLELSSENVCVLGQVFGGFATGIELLDLAYVRDQAEHGFNMTCLEAVFIQETYRERDEPVPPPDVCYEPLTAAWRKLIEKRLSAPVTA